MSRRRYTQRAGDLTLRQKCVAACLLDGMTDKEILRAADFSSLRTVESHMSAIKAHMGARNRVHLALLLERQSQKAPA